MSILNDVTQKQNNQLVYKPYCPPLQEITIVKEKLLFGNNFVFDLMGNSQYNFVMGDEERRILEKHVFIPIYGEDGRHPVAPAEAVEKYYRLRKKGSLNHRTRLYPSKENGMTHYVVLREIITTSLT